MIRNKDVRLLVAVLIYVGMMSFASSASRPAVEMKNGMVVTTHRLASEAGVEILKMGGNAIDAAVAVGYAQAVVNPCCGNIGGGGFMLLHLADGQQHFINFREKAPAQAFRDMYLDAQGKLVPAASLDGYSAVAVPGTVMGMERVLSKYGRLTRQQVMAPAIKLARDGFILTRADTDILAPHTAKFQQDPSAAKIFLKPDGSPWQPGDRLMQTDLARTLTAIARHGQDAFYKGHIPALIERLAKQGHGVIRASDFASYHVTEDTPLTCRYRGYVFTSAPPPSSGGITLCQILNILAGYDLRAMGFGSAASIHVMVEAMRQAYYDRNRYLGDPDFVHNPLDQLLSPAYTEKVRAKILPDRATPSADVHSDIGWQEPTETTHYSIVDKFGNAVSTSYTINGPFGAGVIAPGTGFFLNNEMADFTTKVGSQNLFGLVQGATNGISAGKRPLSSMAPTMVTRHGKLMMVLGSPGGPRIISTIMAAAINIIDHRMPPQAAVNAARFHHQWLPDVVYYEKYGLSPDTLTLLRRMGYQMVAQIPWGAVELILIGLPEPLHTEGTDRSGYDDALSGRIHPGYLYGANDDRRPVGAALGY
jgi:gamma-glutamyltranspeptidase/glutathione hydrolase